MQHELKCHPIVYTSRLCNLFRVTQENRKWGHSQRQIFPKRRNVAKITVYIKSWYLDSTNYLVFETKYDVSET